MKDLRGIPVWNGERSFFFLNQVKEEKGEVHSCSENKVFTEDMSWRTGFWRPDPGHQHRPWSLKMLEDNQKKTSKDEDKAAFKRSDLHSSDEILKRE